VSENSATLAEKMNILRLRARVIREIREFFASRNYWEVETPVRVRTPALEDHIDAQASDGAWLRTSPELHMKRMLCAGAERIMQIGPCFRRGERGDRHLPEYTMLEWYRKGGTLDDLLEETMSLLRRLAQVDGCNSPPGVDFNRDPLVLSVAEAFGQWAGWNPVEAFDEARFDEDMAQKIEPRIAETGRVVVLSDFPAARAALAKLDPANPRTALRRELYLGDMELANAYQELTDAAEQRRRFEACAAGRRVRDQDVYPLDEPFLQALNGGMPEAAGIALGLDRLLMALTGARSISEVVAFTNG